MPNREEFPTMYHPIRVLFLCTGNSARSQMAEALLRICGGTDFEVASAGIDVSKQQSKSLDRFLGQSFNYIITVCDPARDNCPAFPGDNERIHWGFDDPAAAIGSRAQQLAAFRRVRNEISERLRLWVAVQRRQLSEKRPRR
jgi:arsenate reductase